MMMPKKVEVYGSSARLSKIVDDETEMQHKYGQLADNIHTALHEVLGHASGKTYVDDPQGALPGYYSTLEEARADLVAMWHIWDEKVRIF